MNIDQSSRQGDGQLIAKLWEILGWKLEAKWAEIAKLLVGDQLSLARLRAVLSILPI